MGLDKILLDYIQLAEEYGRKTDTGVKTTTEIGELDTIAKRLFENGRISELRSLWTHTNEWVVLLASSTLLEIFPDEACEQLRKLEKDEVSLVGFEAKWTLRVFLDGDFIVSYKR